MRDLIDRIFEGGPVTVGVVGLDVVVLLSVVALAIWARWRSAQVTGYLVSVAVVPALLSMAVALLFLSEYPSADEWISKRLADEYPEFMDPAGRFLGGADIIRLILYAGFITTLLSLLAAYGSRKPRGRFEHALGMVIGCVIGAISFLIGTILMRIAAHYFERSDLPHPPPPEETLSSEVYFGAVMVAVVFIASLVLAFWSYWKFRLAAFAVEVPVRRE